ncbi:Flp family type IVb pilin [Bosea sp. 124]|uniref:Flp family type IVb pilin n=1 Tax=Bosea sp. 124 TaxID=2135642 RepID=UPI000D37A704|nr:Flp family type IVb pilin [Bosea sp. 124]
MTALFVSFVRDERGATAIEYGFIAALMSIATMTFMAQIGVRVSDLTEGVMEGLR